jgi:hypothetical protein
MDTNQKRNPKGDFPRRSLPIAGLLFVSLLSGGTGYSIGRYFPGVVERQSGERVGTLDIGNVSARQQVEIVKLKRRIAELHEERADHLLLRDELERREIANSPLVIQRLDQRITRMNEEITVSEKSLAILEEEAAKLRGLDHASQTMSDDTILQTRIDARRLKLEHGSD